MKSVLSYIMLFIFVLGDASIVFAQHEHDSVLESLTVMADPSLSVPLDIIARQYAVDHNISVTTVYSPTHRQIQAIEAGEEANILIAAKVRWIDELQQKGLIDVFSRTNIARNRLVIATHVEHKQNINPTDINTIQDITPVPDDFMFVIGDPEYTAEGYYAMQALSHHDLHLLLEPYYSFIGSMHKVARLVTEYHAQGLMFRSDALLHPKVRIAHTFKPSTHSPILYQAAVIADARMEPAREFLEYLISDSSRATFKVYGLDPVF